MWRLLSCSGFHSYNVTVPIFLTMKQKFIRGKTLLKEAIWHLYMLPKVPISCAINSSSKSIQEVVRLWKSKQSSSLIMPFWHKQLKAYISVQAIGSENKLQTRFVLFYFLLPLPLVITASTMTSHFTKCIFRISLQAAEFRFESSNVRLSVPFFQSHQTAIKP